MDEVIRSSIICFCGNISLEQGRYYRARIAKENVSKNFEYYEEAFNFLQSKNYELDLVKNRVYLQDNILKVQIKSKDEVYYTFLDDTDENWEILDNYVLSFTCGYAVASKTGTTTRLHNLITNFQYSKDVDKEIDHIDGNPLNNTKANLRIVSHSVNQINRRRIKKSNTNERNIHWVEQKKRYLVNWRENKVKKYKYFYPSSYDFVINPMKQKHLALLDAIQFKNDYVYQLPDYKQARSI